MSNIGYREIMDTSPLSIKQLNDTLRALWGKVMGHIEERDLDDGVISLIQEATDTEALETRITQNAREVAVEASRQATDELTGKVEANTAALSVQAGQIEGKVSQTTFDQLSGEVQTVQSQITQQADQIAAKVSASDFEEFAETVLTKDAFEVNIDGENQLHVGEDGVSAASVTAPNVAAVYAGAAEIEVNPNFADSWLEAHKGEAVRNLQQALDLVNDKQLKGTVKINMNNTSHYERADIHGVSGSGVLEIYGNGSTFYGGIDVQYCAAKVIVMGNNMLILGGDSAAVNVAGCSFVRIDGARVTGSGTDGVYYTDGSRGLLWNCDFAGYTNALHSTMMAGVLAVACTGSGIFKASLGGVIAVSGTMPTGGPLVQANGQVWSDGAEGTSGSTPGISTSITAAEYNATVTATCRNSGSWMAGQLRQNFYEGLGACKACIWFDNATIRSAMSGHTVKSASLRLHRVPGSGKSSAVQVTARGLTLTGASGLVPNDTYNSVYGGVSAVLGTLANDETVTFALPVAMVNALISGSINGFALYAGETSSLSNRAYSSNYCRLDGVGDPYAPVLTINYM